MLQKTYNCVDIFIYHFPFIYCCNVIWTQPLNAHKLINNILTLLLLTGINTCHQNCTSQGFRTCWGQGADQCQRCKLLKIVLIVLTDIIVELYYTSINVVVWDAVIAESGPFPSKMMCIRIFPLMRIVLASYTSKRLAVRIFAMSNNAELQSC